MVRSRMRLRESPFWREPIVAPEFFSLGVPQHRLAVLAFLRFLRQEIAAGRSVYIDFRQTRRMFSDGTLLFLAELSRLFRALERRPVVRCNYPKDRIVEQVLQQVGIFDMIGKLPRVDSSEFAETVKFWKFATGTQAIGEEFEPVLQKYDGIIESRLALTMYKGVTEAMTNASNHAYIAERGDGLPFEQEERRWWMFSQEREGRLYVSLCDLGIGIPNSLPRTRWKDWTPESISKFVSDVAGGSKPSNDCVMIKAAIELGRTRTELAYRGRGLQQLRDVIDAAGGGDLTIHSNRGLYRYNPSNALIETINDFSDSIMGTLILWNVPIPSGDESGTHD